jgi:hypothetical protein
MHLELILSVYVTAYLNFWSGYTANITEQSVEAEHVF